MTFIIIVMNSYSLCNMHAHTHTSLLPRYPSGSVLRIVNGTVGVTVEGVVKAYEKKVNDERERKRDGEVDI